MNDIINITEILNLLPHRYPFLLIDRIVELKVGEYAVGIKNVSYNEPQFTGHFPSMPVMPGVLIIEAMAQTSAILVARGDNSVGVNKTVYFMAISDTKFRKVVTPGDCMKIKVKIQQNRGSVWKFIATAMVDEELVAESAFTAMVKDK